MVQDVCGTWRTVEQSARDIVIHMPNMSFTKPMSSQMMKLLDLHGH